MGIFPAYFKINGIPLETLYFRAGIVGGNAQYRYFALELLEPVRLIFFEIVVLPPGVLPPGKILVLYP